jgi:hypothetical protein
MNVKAAPPSYPAINIGFPPEMMAAFHPPQHTAPAPMPTMSPMLLPLLCGPGTNMSITEFCIYYELDDSIHAWLDDNGFKVARVLQYVAVNDLKEMGFKFWETVALKDGVGCWSVCLAT